MDGYQFVASLFQALTSLAWPGAFVLAVWLFREKLVELLPLLRVKYKDVDVSFRLDQAEKEAATLPPPTGVPPPSPTPEEKSRFLQMAGLSPRAAILEVRSELEEVLRRLVSIYSHPTTKRPWTILTATRELRNRKIISPQTSALLDDLRIIGNTAAHGHGDEFTKDDAIRFRELADQIIAQLQDGGCIETVELSTEPLA